jgi:hypothetical protein
MVDTPSLPILNFYFSGIASQAQSATTLTQPQQQASPPFVQVQQLSQATQPAFGYFVPQNTNLIQQPQTFFAPQNFVGQQQPQIPFIQPQLAFGQQAQQQIPVWTSQQQPLSSQYQQPMLSQFPQQNNQQLSPVSQFPQTQHAFGYNQQPQPLVPVCLQVVVQQPVQPFALGDGAVYDPIGNNSTNGTINFYENL